MDQRRRNILTMKAFVVLILLFTILMNDMESSVAEDIQNDLDLVWLKLNEKPISQLIRMRGKRPYHPNHFFLRRWRFWQRVMNNEWK